MATKLPRSTCSSTWDKARTIDRPTVKDLLSERAWMIVSALIKTQTDE